MSGLGDPKFNKVETNNEGLQGFDKLTELEQRIATLEKTLGWMKWVIAFIGIFMLTNSNNNKNEN